MQDREEARGLTGALIGVPRDAIPEPEDDEFWYDLIGCEVINAQDENLGIVREVMETGAHAILSIQSQTPSALSSYPLPNSM